MITNLPKLDENAWPKTIRKAINSCIDRINRPIEADYKDSITKPIVTEADNKIQIDIPTPGSGLPVGNKGDILYNDGDDWVVLEAPTEGDENPVLRFDLTGGLPYWETPGCD